MDPPPTPVSQGITNPQDDAERIRLKRLAKLQNAPTLPSAPASASSTPPTPQQPPPKLVPKFPAPKRPADVAVSVAAPRKKIPVTAQKLDLQSWEHDAIEHILGVTLDRSVAEKTGYEIVWLKALSVEMESEGFGQPSRIRLNGDIVDRLLISRLELDPQSMSDDLEYLPCLASLPEGLTTFEYLVGSWKRLNSTRSALLKKGYQPLETQRALDFLEKLRDLLISYAGLVLQEPDMFPHPTGRPVGPAEFINPLLSLSALSGPLLSTTPSSSLTTLSPTEVEPFLQELAKRFEPDNELDLVLSPVVRLLLSHGSLSKPEGLAGGDASWRAVIGGLEALVSVKSIAVMITRMPEWLADGATAATFEKVTLMGPLCRLGVFTREWPSVTQTYFSEPEQRRQADVISSTDSLRGTLKSLQSSLFRVFNALVRASPESKEAVLQYFAKAVSLNVKRAGMQVDPMTVSSDSFLVNLQSVMLKFAEPFMDAKYSKIDRIDPLYFASSSRLDSLKEETRIKATSEEVAEWAKSIPTPNAPNFISEVFYLTLAMNHFGHLQTIRGYDDLDKHLDDLRRQLDWLEGDLRVGSPFQARTEAAIKAVKTEMSKIHALQLAYRTQLFDAELVFQSIGFINFVSTWLIRQVDPRRSHPAVEVSLPLPNDVPMAFRTLPELIIEDIVDYLLFVARSSPESFDLCGKSELVTFALTFLTSTWYIKNPFLKAKINEFLFFSTLPYGRERNGVLGLMLNSYPLALKHLIPALMHFYIEVEQTGASSQFYDKFNARRNISYTLKVVWNNPSHRMALKQEAQNVDKFVRFVNLMINDVTYLMDESLSELAQIHTIQTEMEDTATWEAQPAQHRREREGTLRSLERHASGYTTLGRSTVELLKDFTAETKAPFMMPEIVNKLAAMLGYNLDALVGPKCQELRVKEPDKYKFDPKRLLSDILQVFLNLSDQPEFIRAVAGDGRSYRKSLFEKAAKIATNKSLKTDAEIKQLLEFVDRVEEAKVTLEAEDDLGDIPDEFLDPVLCTLMHDPVTLPSSRTVVDRSTIKSHLLSDSKDPFNRSPLKIEDVIPDVELKARIDEFLLERRAAKTTKMDED